MLSADKARLYMEPENLKKKLSLQTCQYIQYIKDKHINLQLKYTHLHPHLIIKGFLIEI